MWKLGVEFHVKNFWINGIEPYCKRKFESENRLSKHLVPYVYAKDLDKEAEKFLKKYYPRALESPMRIHVKEVVENMGLNLKILHIMCLVEYFFQIQKR